MKTVVQCDFDGTITEEDASFFLLDCFAQGDWRRLLQDYKEHKISVGYFNTHAFALINTNKVTLLNAIKGKIKIRPGFSELVDCCSLKGFRLVIISNGLDFYIQAMLEEMGLRNIEVYAAQTQFYAGRLQVQYIGPDNKQSDDGLKKTYAKLFLEQGYRLIYIGDGDSDITPAKHAHKIFARDDLLTYCRENKIRHEPFDDLNDVVRVLELL